VDTGHSFAAAQSPALGLGRPARRRHYRAIDAHDGTSTSCQSCCCPLTA